GGRPGHLRGEARWRRQPRLEQALRLRQPVPVRHRRGCRRRGKRPPHGYLPGLDRPGNRDAHQRRPVRRVPGEVQRRRRAPPRQLFGPPANAYAAAVAADGSGNVLLTGSYDGPIDFGGGPLTFTGVDDAFVAKLTPGGAIVWSAGFGTSASGAALEANGT